MFTLKSFDFDIEHIKGKDNHVADGFSRLCPDDRSELKPKKDRDVTIESFEGGEESVEAISENLMTISLMEILNFTDSPSIPKLFITLMTEHFEEQLELWALPVIEYETMSDQEIPKFLH
jgi:hypothetical protein